MSRILVRISQNAVKELLKKDLTLESVKKKESFLDLLYSLREDLSKTDQNDLLVQVDNYLDKESACQLPLQRENKVVYKNENVFDENGSHFINYLNSLKIEHDDSLVEIKEIEAEETTLKVEFEVYF